MPLDTRIALGVQPLQVQFRDPMASYNQLAQLQSADTQNQLAQMQMQEARQLAPLRLQEQQSRAATAKLTLDEVNEAQTYIKTVMAKAAEASNGTATTNPFDAAKQMMSHPNSQVQAAGLRLLESYQKLQAFEQQAQFLKDEGGAPAPAGAPAAVASGFVDNVEAPMTVPSVMQGGYSYQKDITNALAPAVAAAPAVNAMIPAVASVLQNADALKKEIEKGDRTYGRAPGWKSKRELLVEAYKQALKPEKADSTFAAINPSDYTPDSVKAFLVSKNYGDLVAKAGKADKLVGAVNPSDYTPASIAAFNVSGNYADLVAKAGKADKLIGNVNPSDYTPESVKAFSLSSDYGDLVLKPAKADKVDKLIGNVNPSDYTPESVAAFSLSNNYSDLVLKPAKADKADKTIANVNPDSYTPASVAAFALSGNYADLVLRPEKAKDSKNIANVNPNDFTPASIEKFVASGKYSDLVSVKKAGEGGAAKDDPKTTAAFREVDAAGNVTFYNKFGNPISTQKGAGKPSATFEKTTAQRKQLSSDLTTAITELTEVTKDGGLIDQSTGSGAGRLVDMAARFGGKAMPGDIAIGKLQPIADLVLKMVPRFEGPQSNADTTSYKQAAAQLADPTLPAAIRKEAGKTVMRLMKKRKDQFVTQNMADEGTVLGGGAPAANVDALLDKYK